MRNIQKTKEEGLLARVRHSRARVLGFGRWGHRAVDLLDLGRGVRFAAAFD